jgi:hypothetical protein
MGRSSLNSESSFLLLTFYILYFIFYIISGCNFEKMEFIESDIIIVVGGKKMIGRKY